MTATLSKPNYLFFYRSKGETIEVGEGDDKVSITVEAINDRRVKLAIQGGKHVPVNRAERNLKERS